jgi:hypothetical protein
VFAFYLQFRPERSSPMSQTIYSDTEVAYWVIPADESFSVEVATQWNHPRTVNPFATAADAKAWIAEHRRRVQLEGSRAIGFAAPVTAMPAVVAVPEAADEKP